MHAVFFNGILYCGCLWKWSLYNSHSSADDINCKEYNFVVKGANTGMPQYPHGFISGTDHGYLKPGTCDQEINCVCFNYKHRDERRLD